MNQKMGFWIAIGVAIGCGVGVATHNAVREVRFSVVTG